MSTREERLISHRRFFVRVSELNDTGKLASLRRNVGNTLENSHNALWCFQLINQHSSAPQDAPWRSRQENIFFLAACLAATDRKLATIAKGKEMGSDAASEASNIHADFGNFGRSMLSLKAQSTGSPESIDRRFTILLDSDLDPAGSGELAYRLRQIMKMALGKGVTVNWALLLEDLLNWNRPDKSVQKSWARSYWAPESTDARLTDASLTDSNTK